MSSESNNHNKFDIFKLKDEDNQPLAESTKEQIDLGLSKLLNDLESNKNTTQENNINIDTFAVDNSNNDHEIDSLVESFETKKISSILLAPKVIEKLSDMKSANLRSDTLINLAITLWEELKVQNESNIAELLYDTLVSLDLNDEQKNLIYKKPLLQKDSTQKLTSEPNRTSVESDKYAKNICQNVSRDKKNTKNFWVLSILSLLFFVDYFCYINYSRIVNFLPLTEPLAISDNAISSITNEKSIFNPLLDRIDVSNLSALVYQVERPVIPQPISPTPNSAKPQVKAKINTDEPLEPERVAKIMDELDSSIYEKPNQPAYPRAPLTSDRLDRDRPGRFETGERYEVLINTSVMEAPSFNAKEVEELFVGDRVRVEARIGRWLKIRSRDGYPGYILAQDAQKLYD